MRLWSWFRDGCRDRLLAFSWEAPWKWRLWRLLVGWRWCHLGRGVRDRWWCDQQAYDRRHRPWLIGPTIADWDAVIGDIRRERLALQAERREAEDQPWPR